MTRPTTSSWLLRNSLRKVDDEKLAITSLFLHLGLYILLSQDDIN